MKRNAWLVASLSLCLLTYAAGAANATTTRRNQWRAFYPNVCTTLFNANCTVCHTSTSGSAPFNAYGALLDSNGRNYAAAEAADSDGDGRTNGQEINQDCTLPGDLTSPVTDTKWGALKSTYR